MEFVNQAQSRHIKSMASHIREHAEALIRSMQSLEKYDISMMTQQDVEKKFQEVDRCSEEMKQVLADMMPRLAPLQNVTVTEKEDLDDPSYW